MVRTMSAMTCQAQRHAVTVLLNALKLSLCFLSGLFVVSDVIVAFHLLANPKLTPPQQPLS